MQKKELGNEQTTLTVIILLVYVMTTFIPRTLISLPIHLGNFSFTANWKMIDLITPAAGFIAALGVYRMVEERGSKSLPDNVLHTIIPFASAVSLGITLRNVQVGLGWVAILLLGGLLLYLVFLSENVICDPSDARAPFVLLLLTSLVYATFLITAIGIRVNITRLVFELPILSASAFILSMRLFTLQGSLKAPAIYAVVVMLLLGQFAAALHYWPITASSYGILLFLGFYLLTNIVIIIPQRTSLRAVLRNQAWIIFALLVLCVYFESTN